MNLEPELVRDELDLILRAIAVRGADLLDLGCGDGAMTRRLDTAGAHVTGVEVDAAAVARAGSDITVVQGRAEALPFPAGAFDAVLMLKSFHHVPAAVMGQAMCEVARVLRPHGVLFCWEPIFAGSFNDIMRIFHDEQAERRAALVALHDTIAEGTLEFVDERLFRIRIEFRGFEDFKRRMLHLATLPQRVEGDLLDTVRAAWTTIGEPCGGRFERLMRLTLARKPENRWSKMASRHKHSRSKGLL